MDFLTAPPSTNGLPSVRVVARMDNWWFSKVAPALALAYCAVLVYHVPPWHAARSILLIAFVFFCAGSYGHMVNDVFDIEVDHAAGKRNHMASFAPWKRLGLCLLPIVCGFAPALFITCSRTSILLLAIEFLLPTIYSVPPIRLKGRGTLGLVCDSMGAHTVPCLYAISVLAFQTPNPELLQAPATIAFAACTFIWALYVGMLGILVHEFEDRDNDLRAGIRTFATSTGFNRVRRSMTFFFIVELCAFAGLAWVLSPVAPFVVVVILLFLFATATKLSANWHHYRHYNRRTVAIQWWQLTHPLYEAYLPVAAAIQCAWVHPALLPFPILQLAVFAPTFRKQIPEILSVLRHVLASLAWGGRLDVDQGAAAWALPFFIPGIAAHIIVTRPGTQRWNIRLLRPRLKLQAGREYRILFRIRANRPRHILFGVWQDHDPWQGLGYAEELPIAPRWQTIDRRFIATADDNEAYFGFWVGAETGSVDLVLCSIRPTGPRTSIG